MGVSITVALLLFTGHNYNKPKQKDKVTYSIKTGTYEHSSI